MTPEEILALRQAMGLSQNGLARRMKVSLGTVQNWEAGRYKPNDSHLRWLKRLTRDYSTVESTGTWIGGETANH